MPANSSSILQPLDQGVIAAFKVYYRNLISIRTNVILENNPQLDSYSALKVITVLDAINFIIKGWSNVTPETIKIAG